MSTAAHFTAKRVRSQRPSTALWLHGAWFTTTVPCFATTTTSASRHAKNAKFTFVTTALKRCPCTNAWAAECSRARKKRAKHKTAKTATHGSAKHAKRGRRRWQSLISIFVLHARTLMIKKNDVFTKGANEGAKLNGVLVCRTA